MPRYLFQLPSSVGAALRLDDSSAFLSCTAPRAVAGLARGHGKTAGDWPDRLMSNSRARLGQDDHGMARQAACLPACQDCPKTRCRKSSSMVTTFSLEGPKGRDPAGCQTAQSHCLGQSVVRIEAAPMARAAVPRSGVDYTNSVAPQTPPPWNPCRRYPLSRRSLCLPPFTSRIVPMDA